MVSREPNAQAPPNYTAEESPKQLGETPALTRMVSRAVEGQRRAVTAAERTEKTRAFARSEFEQSQQAFRQRDFATALTLVDEADKADPNQPATVNLRGEILMQQGKFDDAETVFKKAAKLDPKLRDAQYNLAQILFKKKEYANARDRFDTLYKRISGGDKNQAAELIKFKIYMTYLMEGKESKAHSMMEEFQFTGDTPALYYAQAAWEYKHNNAQKAEDWTSSANKIYSPALNVVFADAFYDVGWLQIPEGTTAPVVAFDSGNVGAAQTDGGPAVEPSPIPDKGGALSLATSTNASTGGMALASAGATADQTSLTATSPQTNSGAEQAVVQSPAAGGESTTTSQPVAANYGSVTVTVDSGGPVADLSDSGVWNAQPQPAYTGSDVARYVGLMATVTGKVASFHQSAKGNIFLNMGGKYPNQVFTAWVPSVSAAQFANPQQYEGKTISVSGKITLSQGKPEIKVTSPSQITTK
jgi:tetratricopeptide (TPR) repeat protein